MTVTGLLGGDVDPGAEAVCFCTFEADIDPRLVADHGRLSELMAGCRCGRCRTPTRRVYCNMLGASLGFGWAEFADRYEEWLGSERYDFVLWNNLTQWHGAVMGSASRLLRPMYLSVIEPVGDGYEAWLSRLWHDGLAVAAA